MRRAALTAALSLASGLADAQGTVQARDPRRPPPLERTARCEVWEGTIAGNDPTAQASMQVCAGEGLAVTGVFLWSSLQSGWDRRAFVGAWSADGASLTLRDTHMIESHPMNGWMLCTADRYELRRTVPTRLDGTYDSAGCSDHGRISLLLRGEGTLAERPPTPAADVVPEPPRPARPRCRCDAGPTPPPGLAPLCLAFVAIALRRRRFGRG